MLLKLIHLFVREVLLVKKLEIQETKTDIIKGVLVFSISNSFITKPSLSNKWMRKKIPSGSNSALLMESSDVMKRFQNFEKNFPFF